MMKATKPLLVHRKSTDVRLSYRLRTVKAGKGLCLKMSRTIIFLVFTIPALAIKVRICLHTFIKETCQEPFLGIKTK